RSRRLGTRAVHRVPLETQHRPRSGGAFAGRVALGRFGDPHEPGRGKTCQTGRPPTRGDQAINVLQPPESNTRLRMSKPVRNHPFKYCRTCLSVWVTGVALLLMVMGGGSQHAAAEEPVTLSVQGMPLLGDTSVASQAQRAVMRQF